MESNAVDVTPQIDSTTIMNPLDPDEFKRQGYIMIDFLAAYYRNVANYPVFSRAEPNYLRKRLPESAPFDPQPIEAILQNVQQHIIPGITQWQSPNFFAYFPAAASTAGFVGEMLSTGLNVVGFNWLASPATIELESVVMNWLELCLIHSFHQSTAFALSPESLLSTILVDVENGLIPCLLCATVGTTSTTAIDPIVPLCNVAKKFGMWVHVDAAHAGSAYICPDFRNPSDLTKSLSTNPTYLRNKASDSKEVIDFKDWQIALGRKFNSLKLWIILQSYGIGNLRNFLRNHVKMAKTFEELVEMDERFEIFVRRTFSLVCFWLKSSAIGNGELIGDGKKAHQDEKRSSEDFVNQVNKKLLDLINGSSKVYLTHATVAGNFVLRCSIGATLTEENHVIMMWKVVHEMANYILSKPIKAPF
ncbi:hypothetical protein L6164_002931 [Bauhinia variegata]|uniref:Uncharacterized protein n=1 Tax=Bauhinia variegata TaxID=167791 RepID=A0ACB9Q0B2_BAUVA|nr:hypothetical protein L6164_002931 [Bauhinia variegata]